MNYAISSSLLLSLSLAKIFSSKDYVICYGSEDRVFHFKGGTSDYHR
jgi:hypothetical protein